MEFIYGYIKGICGFMLVLTLIFNLFPESTNKKYIKLFAGLLLLSLVMQPVFKMTNSNWNISKILSEYSNENNSMEWEKSVENLKTKMYERAWDEYQKNNGI